MTFRKKSAFILLSVIILFTVSSCVYLRFLKLKNQMADFNKNFEITEENGLSLVFLNPVLKKSDMVWLMGTEPTIMEVNGNPDNWIYELKKRYRGKKNEEGDFDIPLDLTFEKNKLTKFTMPERFTKYFSKSLFEKFLSTLGQAEIDKGDKQASSTYEGASKTEIPTTKEIKAVLGNPYSQGVTKEARTFIYRYKILSPDPEKKLGVRITYNFNKETDFLESVLANIKGLKVKISFSDLK